MGSGWPSPNTTTSSVLNPQTVDVLANCTKLTKLNLAEWHNLLNVDALANCTKLTQLDLSGCKQLRPKSGQVLRFSLEEVSACLELIKKSMK